MFAISTVATPVLARAVDLDRVVAFSIERQSLESALIAFSKQSEIQVIITPKVNGTAEVPALNATVSARVALDTLLRNTGLTYEASGESVNVTRAVEVTRREHGLATASRSQTSATQPQTGGDRTRELGADQLPSTASAPNQTTDRERQRGSGGAVLEEVLVTAQKREERLQDVPVPVTAISAATLVDSNQLRLQDYYTSVPGLSFTVDNNGHPALAIRGITSGIYANPTVGIEVDDVPYGGSASYAATDIDPSDLARVEVLRGPQGTIYGASSMGGLLKFVTVAPSTDSASARVQVGTSSVHNGAELGYTARGSVNVPLSDTLAIRASAFTRQDPGYIDNPVLHVDGINETHVSGGRLSALWRPSDVFSIKLSALYQEARKDGSDDVQIQPGLGDLQQDYIRGAGGYVGGSDRTVQAYSSTVTGKLGIADLTAVTGYNVDTAHDSFDFTYVFGPLNQGQFGVTGAPDLILARTRKFTQELRLSLPIGQKVEWLFGAFYTHEDTAGEQAIVAADVTGAQVGTGIIFGGPPSTYAEYAAFTDLTFHFTDRFDVQVGGRESQIRQGSQSVVTGPFVPIFYGVPSPSIAPKLHSKANPFTYLLTSRFKVSSDLMVYARLASGYRAGGPNGVPGAPSQYEPDKTENYELGVKGDLLDHTISVDASVYYINWKDIQLQLLTPTGLGYTGNASGAKSQGVELSVESRPLSGLMIAAWFAWNDAVLTKDLPPAAVAAGTYGVSGDRLPLSSRISGNVSLNEEFPLASQVTGFVGGTVSYVGDRVGVFTGGGLGQASGQRQIYPAYAKTDLRAGMRYESWTANIFVNNVADKRGLLNGGVGALFHPFAFSEIQPRTVGLSLSKSF
jgi:outer membrane receptor protein involved in Fe transport